MGKLRPHMLLLWATCCSRSGDNLLGNLHIMLKPWPRNSISRTLSWSYIHICAKRYMYSSIWQKNPGNYLNVNCYVKDYELCSHKNNVVEPYASYGQISQGILDTESGKSKLQNIMYSKKRVIYNLYMYVHMYIGKDLQKHT